MSREKGFVYEQHAVNYLLQEGYRILEQNLRIGYKEIDVLAMDSGVLVIVEVKAHGFDALHLNQIVSASKIKHLQEAANIYVDRIGFEGEMRLDVIEIRTSEQNKLIHHSEVFIL